MRKIAALLSIALAITLLVSTSMASGVPLVVASSSEIIEETYTAYEAAYKVYQNSLKNITSTDVYIDYTNTNVSDYLSLVDKQMNSLSGYIFRIKGTYIKKPGIVKLTIECTRSAEESDKVSTIEKGAINIANQTRSKYSDIKKQLAYINDLLVNLCCYDKESAADIENASDLAWSAYGCLINGKAVCGGYTNAFTVLCEKLGVPVYEVTGNSPRGILHTWNKVYVDNAWRNVDVTSNDPTWNKEPSKLDIDRTSKRFFLLSDAAMQNLGYTWTTERDAVIEDTKYPDTNTTRAAELKELGIIRGTNSGYELNRLITRAETAIIAARMMNAEKEIISNSAYYAEMCKFPDVVGWERPYIGYCVSKGILNGLPDGTFGPKNATLKRDYAVVMLRILGVTDYKFTEAADRAIELGILAEGRNLFIRSVYAYRSDAVDMTFNALGV